MDLISSLDLNAIFAPVAETAPLSSDQPTATLERVLTLAMQQKEELGSMINIK